MVTVPLIYKGLPDIGAILAILLPLSWILLTYERQSTDKPGTPGGNTLTKDITMKSNNRFTKVAVATGLIVCSGAAVLGLTGFASALVANNPVAVVAATDDAATTDSGAPAVTADESGTGTITGSVTPQGLEATASAEMHADRPNPLSIAAKAIGVTEAELRTELQAGKSIADVAKAKNVDIADVKKALLDQMKTHLAEEVASGKHTQAEADAKLAEATTRIDTMVTTAGLPMGRGGHGGMKGGHGGPAKFASADLAKVLKLTEAELQTQLRSGKSLADIAKAQSVDIADVKAQLTAGFTAHLDEEVKAGEHTQAEADAKLAEFKTRLDDMVNGVRPAGGMKGDKMGGMMGGRHGGRGGHGHGDGPMGVPGAATDGTSSPTGASFSA